MRPAKKLGVAKGFHLTREGRADMNTVTVMNKGGVMATHKDDLSVGVRLAFWGISSDASDEYGRELYTKKFGKPPATIIRYPRCILLLGPIVEGNPMQGCKP